MRLNVFRAHMTPRPNVCAQMSHAQIVSRPNVSRPNCLAPKLSRAQMSGFDYIFNIMIV